MHDSRSQPAIADELTMLAEFASSAAVRLLALATTTGDLHGLVLAAAVLHGLDAMPHQRQQY